MSTTMTSRVRIPTPTKPTQFPPPTYPSFPKLPFRTPPPSLHHSIHSHPHFTRPHFITNRTSSSSAIRASFKHDNGGDCIPNPSDSHPHFTKLHFITNRISSSSAIKASFKHDNGGDCIPNSSDSHRHFTKLHFITNRTSSLYRIRASNDHDNGGDNAPNPSGFSNNKASSVVVCSVVTAVLGVTNRVLYKLALVPLKEYPFFLAQFITFGYVAIYFSILFLRHRAGIVTDEMIAIPKWRFVLIGFLEALGVAAGMASAAMLPGPSIPILNQTFLVWQLFLSTIILGTRYSYRQIAGCLLVAAGVVLAVSSGSDGSQAVSRVELVWPALMVASSAFHATASILKEFIFVDAAKRLKGKSLDIFVVNSFGSGCQAVFVLLLLPLLSNMKGIPFTELPEYLKSGAACFLNIGSNNTGCDGAPLLPLLYVANNIAFNISILALLKISSAVVSSLVVMVSVPVSIYALSLPLPYLPEGGSLTPFFLFGSVVLMLGLVLYNLPQSSKQRY